MKLFWKSLLLVLPFSENILLAEEPPTEQSQRQEEIQKAINEAPVISRRTIDHGDRAITIERIEAPHLPEKQEAPPTLSAEERPTFPLTEHHTPTRSLTIISATVVGGEFSHLSWSYRRERFVAWTNLNFDLLRTVALVETESAHHHFAYAVHHAPANTKTAGVHPGPPPVFEEDHPMLLLLEGDINNHEGLAPLVALLDHYQTHPTELAVANQKLEADLAARAAEKAAAALRPPEKERISVKVWTREGEESNDTREEGAAR